MIIRTTDYETAKFFASTGVGNFCFFDGGTYFEIYFSNPVGFIVCKLMGRPTTWTTDLGVYFPSSAKQLNAPLALSD
jgi:hypothetical protein